MQSIRVGDHILTKFWGDARYEVTNIKVGYKKDCFETDIHELYFMDNRFSSWRKAKKVKKNDKLSKT